MAYNTIPLTNDPDQIFSCTIPIDGKNITLGFRFRYNVVCKYWWMSISRDGFTLLDAIPLVTGENILHQYSYLKIGSAYVIKSGGGNGIPDETNLGTEYNLIWGDTIGN